MDHNDYLEAVRDGGSRMAAAGRSGLSAQVAHCPDWDVAGLLGHTAQVYRFVRAVLDQGAADGPPQMDAVPTPEGDAVIDFFEEFHGGVVDKLESLDPTAPVWTWTPRTDAGYFHRRMAHETAVHRWDAENAIGKAGPTAGAVDADLAHDGIDEVINVGMQFSTRGPRSNFPSGSLHLHRTDGDGEWMLSSNDGTLVVTEEHGKGDAALRGTASGLYFYLWGRGRDDLELFGDAAVADAWAEASP